MFGKEEKKEGKFLGKKSMKEEGNDEDDIYQERSKGRWIEVETIKKKERTE
jgi:hypothetical protein